MNGEISMKKKALLAVLLAMTLLLSSCALIKKDAAVDAATVILKLGDEEITKEQVQNATDNQLYSMYQYYYMFGSELDVTDPEVIASAQSSAITSLKKEMTIRAKAKELGLDVLTDEETAKANENAQSDWDTDKETVKAYYMTEEELALEGEELENAVLKRMEELGLKMEDYEADAASDIVTSKLREYAIKDVTVSDEDVKAEYDSKVASAEEKYKEDLESWATADRNGTTTLYYTPAGIRRIKQILVKFKADDQTAIDDANSKIKDADSRITEAQTTIDSEDASEEEKQQAEDAKVTAEQDKSAAEAELKEATDKGFANLDEETDAILAALEEDPDSWDKLVEEKNEDPGMKAGATNAETGYAVFSGMTSFDSAFVDAAMALSSIGEISGKVRGETYGYYILKYAGDETEGAIDYDSVKEDIHSSLLTTKQNSTYTETLNKWVEEIGIKENLGALKD